MRPCVHCRCGVHLRGLLVEECHVPVNVEDDKTLRQLINGVPYECCNVSCHDG